MAFDPANKSDVATRCKLMEEATTMHNELTKKAAMGGQWLWMCIPPMFVCLVCTAGYRTHTVYAVGIEWSI